MIGLRARAPGAEVTTALPFSNHHNEIERQIIVVLIEDLLAAGFLLGVYDGEEEVLSSCSDASTIYSAMSSTDEDYLILRVAGGKRAWIRLIYGNGADVISDYTTSVPETVMERANALSERFSGGAS